MRILKALKDELQKPFAEIDAKDLVEIVEKTIPEDVRDGLVPVRIRWGIFGLFLDHCRSAASGARILRIGPTQMHGYISGRVKIPSRVAARALAVLRGTPNMRVPRDVAKALREFIAEDAKDLAAVRSALRYGRPVPRNAYTARAVRYLLESEFPQYDPKTLAETALSLGFDETVAGNIVDQFESLAKDEGVFTDEEFMARIRGTARPLSAHRVGALLDDDEDEDLPTRRRREDRRLREVAPNATAVEDDDDDCL